MAHSKSDLLSTRVPRHQHQPRVGRDGKHVAIDPSVTGSVVSHAHAQGRQIEHDFHVAQGGKRKYSGNVDPRVGGAPKTSGPVPVHGQSYHIKDDVHYQSISATQVAKARAGAVDLETRPLSPEATARRYAPAPIHPSMDAPHIELGKRLLAGTKPRQFETRQEQNRKKR